MGIGTVYKATWIDHRPATADIDDGPNYRTVEWDCRHKRECNCRDTAEWFARYHSTRGPAPGYYEMRQFRIRKIRLQRPGRELCDERELVLVNEWAAGQQLVLPFQPDNKERAS